MADFRVVAELAERLAGEGSRLKKRASIAAVIAAVEGESAADRDDSMSETKPSDMGRPDAEDAGLVAMYVAGTPFAESDGRKLSAGGALLTKTLLAVSGASEAELTAAYRKYGDLGAAGFELMEARSVDGGGLTLGEVAEVFAAMAGARTTAVRAGLVEGMLRRASALEVKYLLKLMLGDMRIGVKQSLVEEAIGVAAGVPVGEVRQAVMLEADLAGAVRRAFAGTLKEARMRLFHPLGFMLASPVESPEEAVARFAEKPVVVVKRKKGVAGAGAGIDVSAAATIRAGATAGASTPSLAKGASDYAQDDNFIERDKSALAEDDRLVEGGEGRHIEAFLEDKYDGMRAQVHFGESGRVAVYSRNKEDVTESFPELVEGFGAGLAEVEGVVPCILDGEILGWDFQAGRALPFAVLGQRIGRKRVSNEWRRQVPVVFMAFDLMFEGTELLLELPLRERRNRLEAVVERLVERVRAPLVVEEVGKATRKRRRGVEGQVEMFGVDGPDPTPGCEAAKDGALAPLGLGDRGGPIGLGLERLMISPSRLVESAEDIDRAYAEARARANEGVMLKAAGSVYQPGRRGLAWVKLKRELATLDVVVTGAEFGHGRRAGILSDYTFAVRAEGGELLNVGKAYSGLTDAEIAEMSAWMMEHTLVDEGFFRTVEPLMVLEVAFNNVMRSVRHASGFALRFPRIVRIRTDKPVEEIDTVAGVEAVYLSQVDRPMES